MGTGTFGNCATSTELHLAKVDFCDFMENYENEDLKKQVLIKPGVMCPLLL